MALHDVTVGLPEVLAAEDVQARLDPLAAREAIILAAEDIGLQFDGALGCLVVYNRAILLFTSDGEAVRRVHQVSCRLDDLAGSRRPAQPPPPSNAAGPERG